MSLRICSLASGSSGNCYVICTEDTTLLVDAGISGKQIKERLLESFERDVSQLDGILITHEHSDHIKGLSVLQKLNRNVYATRATIKAAEQIIGSEFADDCRHCFINGDSFVIGDIKVSSFATSHDAADPSGYAFEACGRVICIVTDTGCISDGIIAHMKAADILVLESNHDESVLKMGPYPWFLKQRILSDKGHLSNESAANALSDIVAEEKSKKQRLVLLAHLSKENNFPEMAQATMENILRDKGCEPRACILKVLSRSEVSEIYE